MEPHQSTINEPPAQSVHTGGVAFLLCSLAGGMGGTVGLTAGFGSPSESVNIWERPILAVSWSAGFTCIGVTMGAILGMILGSTLARSFHIVFIAAAAWIALLAALLILEETRGYIDSAVAVRAIAYGGLALLAMSGITGWQMARRTTGFTARSRLWSAMGVAASLITAPIGYGLWTSKLWSLMQWDWTEDDVAITLLIGIALATLAGIAGAIYAADRHVAPGFALLPAQPIQPIPPPHPREPVK